MRNDPSGTGILMYEQFHSLVHQLAPRLTEHEIMTIARYYGDRAEQDAQMDIKTLISIIQEQLRKNNFEGFTNMSENFQHMDKSR
jgi:Ca2+-binding EF-hand superfamily protein